MRNPFRAAAELGAPAAFTGGSSAYQGAVSNRLTMDWVLASIQSADQETRADLRQLRARSRELARNNELATKYLHLLEEQEIGEHGMRLQATVKRPDNMLDRGINQRIEDAWHEWSEPANCTVDGGMSFAEVLALNTRTRAQDGEYLVRMVPMAGRAFGFALQILDPDQLDEQYNEYRGTGQNEIRMGVEIDVWGRPVAYWLYDRHPAESGFTRRARERKSAEFIIHDFKRLRAGQTRGVPWFAPALFKLRMIHGYEEAEVVGMRGAAAQGGFFTRSPESAQDPNAPKADQQYSVDVEPLSYHALPPGWAYQERDPKHPNDAYNEFHKAMIRGIANGLNVSYASLANDLTQVNFSSIRAGLLNERDAWRRLQQHDITHFCTPVYRTWFAYAQLSGALQLPDRNRARWLRHRFLPRGFPWVDPEKDSKANALQVRMGLNSRTRLAAEQGRDFEEILTELAMEEALAAEIGVTLSTDTSTSNSSNENAEPDSEAFDELPESLRARLMDSRLFAHLQPNGNGRHG
jgi:lambda family phage portal protein